MRDPGDDEEENDNGEPDFWQEGEIWINDQGC
jgi:hypothetical protein